MLTVVVLLVGLAASLSAQTERVAVDRGIAFLSAEVPKWSRENKCFSCHNNGDAARALNLAARRGRTIPAKVLADTNAWLVQPGRWEKNGGEGPFSDKRLARIVFSATLSQAIETGQIADRTSLKAAAEKLAGDQSADGSWSLDDPVEAIGSPATYGKPLATLQSRNVLTHADPNVYRDAIARADRWLGRLPIETILDVSVVLLSTPTPDRRKEALALLERSQSADGGWGPYASSPPEVFDTALAILGLQLHRDRPGIPDRIRRGRAYLIQSQLKDGSWPATTRPTGGDSYAQTMSTTGWALMALLQEN